MPSPSANETAVYLHRSQSAALTLSDPLPYSLSRTPKSPAHTGTRTGPTSAATAARASSPHPHAGPQTNSSAQVDTVPAPILAALSTRFPAARLPPDNSLSCTPPSLNSTGSRARSAATPPPFSVVAALPPNSSGASLSRLSLYKPDPLSDPPQARS